jgi:transcription elongation factor Elf1
MTEEEKIRIRPDPTQRKTYKRTMMCPHCNHLLPVDGVTECDECGAHLEVYVKTVVPPINE